MRKATESPDHLAVRFCVGGVVLEDRSLLIGCTILEISKQLDARRCISYLTIELKGTVPKDLRAPIGNRIFGCDDCQLFCPWNRYATSTQEDDFSPRHKLEQPDLLTLFEWTEAEFLEKTEGSAIRRINFQQWQRNLAIALGNGEATEPVVTALNKRLNASSTAAPLSEMVREHITWALNTLSGK